MRKVMRWLSMSVTLSATKQPLHNQSRAGSEVEKSGRQPTLPAPEEKGHDLGPAWEVNRLPGAQEDAKEHQGGKASSPSHQALSQRPYRKSSGVKPTEIET